jgi:hypothetical protein
VTPPVSRPSLAARLAPYRWRLVGLALCVLAYGLVWIAVVAGATPMLGILVTIPALLVLIAGGNWLQSWLGIKRRPPQFARPAREDEVPGGPTAT